MKKLLLSLALLVLSATPSFARARMFGWCEQGNQTIQVLGYVSSVNTPVQASYPQCSVTVYQTGSESIQTGTYQSGGSITGTAGQTITLFITGGIGATATATLTSTNSILAGTALVINTGGSAFTGPATTATCGSGTASCSGTVTITTTITGTLATLYSDNSGDPLTNPFLSNTKGLWFAYADNGRYDVQFSGGTPAAIPNAFTEGDQLLIDPLYDSEFPSISQGCTFAAAIPATLTITKPWLNLTTQTFACDMLVQDGGYLQPASGQVLTFAGVRAGLYRIFDISQSGSIASLVTPVIYPEWFGCVPDTPPLSPIVTNNNACMTAAFNVSSTNRIKLFLNSNPVHAGYCYGITQSIIVGNTTNPTFVSTDGNFQNLGANGGNGQWSSCMVQLTAAQDTLDVLYPTSNKANSIAVRNFSIQYSQGIPGNYVAPYGTVSVSGSVVTLQTATFLSFNTNWVQPGGQASIYIHDSNQFGCLGDICTIASVQSTTQLTIVQSCVSSCPTNADYSVGVGVHIIQPLIQTVGLVMDGVQVMQAGVGYSSDGGDQSPLFMNTTFNLNHVGLIENGGDAIEQWKNCYFQGNVGPGFLLPRGKIMLNSEMDSVVFESNGGPAVEIDLNASMVGGTWQNVWSEFPVGDFFHVYGLVNNWSCVGCIYNFSSISNVNQFVVIGALGGGQGHMLGITLTGGYAVNANVAGGAFTIAESLSGARQDPTNSSDPSFSGWYMNGVDLGDNSSFPGYGLFGFNTPFTGSGMNVLMNRTSRPVIFEPSSVNGSQPNFAIFGPDSAGTDGVVLNANISSVTGVTILSNQVNLGPNSTPVAYATLNVNDNLNSSGLCNTSTTGNVVTVVSVNLGGQLVTQAWSNQSITINGVPYTIKSVLSNASFVLTSNPGNQTSVTYSIQGFTRQIVQAGPGQGTAPIFETFPCGSLCGGSNIGSYGFNHDGFPTTLSTNNNEVGGFLALSGSAGPGGSGTSPTVTFTENAVSPPICTATYTNTSIPGSIPSLGPFALITIGPPTTLIVYGTAGFTVGYMCIKRDN